MKTYESYDWRCHYYRQPVKEESEHVRSVSLQPQLRLHKYVSSHCSSSTQLTCGDFVIREEAIVSALLGRRMINN